MHVQEVDVLNLCICCDGEKDVTQAAKTTARHFPSLVVVVIQETLHRPLHLCCLWKWLHCESLLQLHFWDLAESWIGSSVAERTLLFGGLLLQMLSNYHIWCFPAQFVSTLSLLIPHFFA